MKEEIDVNSLHILSDKHSIIINLKSCFRDYEIIKKEVFIFFNRIFYFFKRYLYANKPLSSCLHAAWRVLVVLLFQVKKKNHSRYQHHHRYKLLLLFLFCLSLKSHESRALQS